MTKSTFITELVNAGCNIDKLSKETIDSIVTVSIHQVADVHLGVFFKLLYELKSEFKNDPFKFISALSNIPNNYAYSDSKDQYICIIGIINKIECDVNDGNYINALNIINGECEEYSSSGFKYALDHLSEFSKYIQLLKSLNKLAYTHNGKDEVLSLIIELKEEFIDDPSTFGIMLYSIISGYINSIMPSANNIKTDIETRLYISSVKADNEDVDNFSISITMYHSISYNMYHHTFRKIEDIESLLRAFSKYNELMEIMEELRKDEEILDNMK